MTDRDLVPRKLAAALKRWTGRPLGKGGKRLIAAIVAVAVGAGASFLAYRKLVELGYVRYNKWDRRVRGTLRVGDQAPDVELTRYDGSRLRLSSLWAVKPAVLVFGSCT
jgi:hypothetical protein